MPEWIDDITAFIFLHDAPQKADILFIPGNGHAEPSEYAAQLYHSGYAPLILPPAASPLRQAGSTGRNPAQGATKGVLKRNGRSCGRFCWPTACGSRHSARGRGDVHLSKRHLFPQTHGRGKADRSPRHPVLHAGSRLARQDVLSDALPRNPASPLPRAGTAITRENWMFEPDGIDQTLGELTRCGSQFHDILREITL